MKINSVYEALPCACLVPPRPGDPLSGYEWTREHCYALRNLVHPDSQWDEIRKFILTPDDVRYSQVPIAFGLYKAGTLINLTGPIHRYLLTERGEVRDDVPLSYRNELGETWVTNEDVLQRNRLSSSYMGKITEICLAWWLETLGYVITGLAATGGDEDVRAVSRDGTRVVLEAKYMGETDSEFKGIIESYRGENGVCGIDFVSMQNRILEKICKAGAQLKKTPSWHRRIAVLAVEGRALFWDELKDNFLGALTDAEFWEDPRYEGEDETWSSKEDPSSLLKGTDEIWLMRSSGSLLLRPEVRIYSPCTGQATVAGRE